MTENPRNTDREELIVGGRAGALEPDEAADVSLMAELLGDPAMWAEPSEGLEEAVVQAVTAAEPHPVAAVTGRRRAGARRSPATRWARVVLGAAAAVVVVVVAGAVVATRGGSSPDFEGELAATALVPDARGSVDIVGNDSGFRITLDADGLAPLEAGEHYQAWLKDEDGTLVAIGTFSSSDDRITLWSGVSPEQFPLLTVTIEAADGDPSSSGRTVLTGELREG